MVGPVRQVDTAPTVAASSDHAPQATVIALTGGSWPAAREHGDALAVLHHQHGDGERHHQLHHGPHGPRRRLQTGAREPLRGARRPDRTARQRDGDRADQQRADERRQPRPSARPSAEQQEGRDHRRRRWRGRRAARAPGRVPNRRNTPATMPITIGIGTACHGPPHPAGEPEHQHQQPGGVEGADHLGEAQVAERRADQHRARDRPEERQRLPVQPAGEHREQAVEEEHAEDPGRQLGGRQPACGADGEDHGDRPGGGEDQADQAVGRVEQADVPAAAAPARRAAVAGARSGSGRLRAGRDHVKTLVKASFSSRAW